MQYRIRVWDWPVRLFHWSMVLVVIAAIATALVGGNWMAVHGWLGITLCGLIGFRLAWGVLGTRTARFSSFVRGPAAIRAYLAGHWQGIGHNPLGALSVLALLGLFGFQAASGLFTDDDIAFTGPLRRLVDRDMAEQITTIHGSLLWWMVGLVVLHVGAVFYYRITKKEKLLGAMVRGWKQSDQPQPDNTPVNPVALLVAIAVGIGCAMLASGIWLPPPPPPPALPVTPDW